MASSTLDGYKNRWLDVIRAQRWEPKMPSPFPGMDPYLEEPDLWSDFHGGMIYAIRAAITRLLPPGYVARVLRYTMRCIHIVDNEDRIVTALEMFCPSQKRPGPDRNAYLAMRQEYLTSGIHLV
jgi:hypothetical protein